MSQVGFELFPSVGVARLGNSPGQFFLSPDTIGGLPYEADQYGNQLETIQKFKDSSGRIRRQGQLFRIFSGGEELTLDSPNVKSIEWTVHLANKKAAWYQFSELKGNLLYGTDNSYANRGVDLRNKCETNRKPLIVDPGPRTLSGREQDPVNFDKIGAEQQCPNYPYTFPNSNPKYGSAVTTLGSLVTDSQGRLVVIGASGNAGGDKVLTSYGGSDTWHDDIADGPIYCNITFKDDSPVQQLQGWVIVGSPDFAPEIVNISTLSDTMFDVGVRHFGLVPEMRNGNNWNYDYQANFHRDILPIMQRIGAYQWVSNVQSMTAFNANIFDFSDNSEANQGNRENYFNYFRRPDDKSNPSPDQPQQKLFRTKEADSMLPMMPVNSGSNSVSNTTIVKFLALNETQDFLLRQWADGKFDSNRDYDSYPVNYRNQASVGNCVGLPMCPGIEVTWSVQNPAIYAEPYQIADQCGKGGYNLTGLTPNRNECEGGGCQPGDLTKRMACPWQADFFQCTIQPVNFTDPAINKIDEAPLPPTYYSYWWPPQAPWDTLIGEDTAAGQAANGGLSMGEQVNYARGINSFNQMVQHWSALAFIRNRNPADKPYPYFTETERNNALFTVKEVPVGDISGNKDDNETTILAVFIAEVDTVRNSGTKGKLLADELESRAFKTIHVAENVTLMPRSGTRRRR